MPNAITVIDNTQLNAMFSEIPQILIQRATEDVERETAGDEWGALQKRSMILVRALQLTSGMDLTTIMTRGALIKQIEDESLVSVHPGQYQTLTQMALDQGISVSELSDTRELYNVIFPYLEANGISVHQIWSGVGKSKFREMAAALSSVITGETAAHNTVRESVTNMLDAAAASLIGEGAFQQNEVQENIDQIRRRAVSDLIEFGATNSSQEIRRRLRPTRTRSVNGIVLPETEGGYIVFKYNGQDQLDMVKRVMNTHAIIQTAGSSENASTNAIRRLFGG